MYQNTPQYYGSVSKWFHWTSSTLVICLLGLGFTMGSFDNPLKSFSYGLHKSTGLLILFLTGMRIIWSLKNPKPVLPNLKPWEKYLERSVHFSLYFLLIAMPLSGWLMSSFAGYHPTFYGLFAMPFPGISENKALSEMASKAHACFAWALVLLITLHILAALKHHFIDKDNVLKRMLPTRQTSSE